MPLFKRHHDNRVGEDYTGDANDPNYAVADAYPGGANANPSGVGAPVDSSYGNQAAPYSQPRGTGAPGRTGPGTMLGHGPSRQANQPTMGYDQSNANYPGAGYDQPNQPPSGYESYPNAGYDQPTNTHRPFRDEVGGGGPGAGAGAGLGAGAEAGAGAGHHLGGRGATGAATTGGFAGREYANQTGNIDNTANTSPTGTTGNMGPKDARMLEMKGKVQQLGGILLSSQSMKSKGAAKEQEAAAIRHHQTNIAEAEAHEAQARLARERAGRGTYH